MPLYTPHYRLWSVTAGEPLDPLEDSKRFLTIDRQLLGLMEIFGNGVIEGWDIVATGGLTVSISPGSAHLNFTSAVTDVATIIENLAPSTTTYVYASVLEETRYTRNVLFTTETFALSGGLQLLLGTVTTNASTVTSIDTSVRNDISFIETIKDIINNHRHKGGSQNPSKIDLASEVMGQLPSYRIDGMDASKITSGRLSPARLPLFNHGDLLDSGTLTHAQLDSFVRSLSASNARLLGELGTSNLMQLYLSFKHAWDECDKYAYNLINVIPGISVDSQIDYANTTAVVDKVNHLVQGVVSTSGSLLSTTFGSQAAFQAAASRSKLDILADNTGTYLQISRPVTELIVENFDNVFQTNQTISGWVLRTAASSSNTTFRSDSSQKADGTFSAKLSVDQGTRLNLTRLFDSQADWSGYNKLEIWVNTTAVNMGPVVLQVLGGTSGNLTILYEANLLDAGEGASITTFKQKIFDISSVSRSSVTGIRFYVDTELGWDLDPFVVNIDRIKVNNDTFFQSEGRVRFRYKTPQSSDWSSISWVATIPAGTQVQARARSAASYEALDTSNIATFCPLSGTSGFDPGIDDNRCVEVEVVLTSDVSTTLSPKLYSMTVSYITPNGNSSIVVDTDTDFNDGEFDNTDVNLTGASAYVRITSTPNIGSHPFIGFTAVAATIRDEFDTSSSSIVQTGLPISPWQALQTTPARGSKFACPMHLDRLSADGYIVCDTMNDRILLMSPSGSIKKCLFSCNTGSNNIGSPSVDIYPTTCCYNRRTGMLYITFSHPVQGETFDPPIDLTKIKLVGVGFSITLSSTADSYLPNKGISQFGSSNTTYHSAVSILLSSANQSVVGTFLDNSGTLFLDIKSDVFFQATQDGGDGSLLILTSSNYLTLVDGSSQKLKIFVGDMTYMDGIFRPISATLTSAGKWLVCNCKKWSEDLDTNSPITAFVAATSYTGGTDIASSSSFSGPPVDNDSLVSIMEVDPDTGVITYTHNGVHFGVMSLGSAHEVDENTLCIGGVRYNTAASGTSFDLDNYFGTARIMDKETSISTFDYTSGSGFFVSDAVVVQSEDTPANYFLFLAERNITGVINSTLKKFPTTNAVTPSWSLVDYNAKVAAEIGGSDKFRINDIRVYQCKDPGGQDRMTVSVSTAS